MVKNSLDEHVEAFYMLGGGQNPLCKLLLATYASQYTLGCGQNALSKLLLATYTLACGLNGLPVLLRTSYAGTLRTFISPLRAWRRFKTDFP